MDSAVANTPRVEIRRLPPIEALPTITRLSFRSWDETVYVLERIIKFESEQEDIVAWPNLQALTIVPFDSEWIQPFCDFIAARIGIGLPLESISLNGGDMEILKNSEFF
jgi:hypothetical protein